jgi:hypothetical protein
VWTKLILAQPETKFWELNNNATHVSAAELMKFQTNQELDVSQDHSLSVDALAEDLLMDTLAPHAQLDKLLTPTMSANVSNKYHVITCQSDLLEMQPTVVDANNAISQEKSQIPLKPDVSKDHMQTAVALKEELTVDINALNAQPDKLPKESTILPQEVKMFVLFHQLVLDNMLSNLLLTVYPVEDARTAPGQDKSQINSELPVLIDHQLNAMTALPDNPLMVTHANNAQLDKFNQLPTLKHATLHNVPNSTRSDLLLTTSTVEDVNFANGQHSCQTHQELHAFRDHSLSAPLASPDNQMMVTHAKTAQLDRSKIQTILDSASPQFVTENTKSEP